MPPPEAHLSRRVGWLRAAVLGANDGIVSTASLILGMASAGTQHDAVLLAGVAGLVAGAMSMAAGEYVSVSSQADTERAELVRERHELIHNAPLELQELAMIYMRRGLDDELAWRVARELMATDALGAHARDELGISEHNSARPLQAALTSAATFSAGAALPLLAAAVVPISRIGVIVPAASLLFLGALGALSAYAGGAGIVRGVVRVAFWGSAAMAVTALIGSLAGHVF
ncbi:MAG: VIT family protein [Burkholderiales bacterium]|nr:VIT family protein [Burkholderiales bacterium]